MQSEWEALRALCHSLSLWEQLRSYENDLPFQTGVILSTTLHAAGRYMDLLARICRIEHETLMRVTKTTCFFIKEAILSYMKSAVRLELVYNCEKGMVTLPVSNHKQLANPLSIREEWNEQKSNAWLPQPRPRGEEGGLWMPLICHLVIGPWAPHEAPCCNIHYCGILDVFRVLHTYPPFAAI